MEYTRYIKMKSCHLYNWLDPESIMLYMKWVREKQTQYDFIYFYDPKKKQNQRFREQFWWLPEEGAGRTGRRIVEGDEEVQTSSYKYLTWI